MGRRRTTDKAVRQLKEAAREVTEPVIVWGVSDLRYLSTPDAARKILGEVKALRARVEDLIERILTEDAPNEDRARRLRTLRENLASCDVMEMRLHHLAETDDTR